MKLTSTLLLGAFAALAFSTVPACDDKKDDKKADDKKTDAKKVETKTETKTEVKEEVKQEVKADGGAADGGAADGGAADGGAAAGGDTKVGIAECDEYIEKYTKCIQDKVPEAARGSMKDAMDMSAKAWKDAASGPAKDGLATACKAALDAAKAATASMGCEW